MENLAALVHLKKLDLGKNKIQKIEGLDTLSSLVQLSLEDNEIESLAGLSRVSTLLELYLGNNKMGDMREVLQVKSRVKISMENMREWRLTFARLCNGAATTVQLRSLPKLIILDLSGNPVCTRPEYRLYTIFHLKKLKVLDGLGVESSEQAAANDTYSGRLTEEFVVEKLGHKFFDHVSELDLSSNKIRDTANCITGEVFGNLRVLNLDNNLISDLSGLTGLSLLAVLRLNHNRIETLGPDKPAKAAAAAAVAEVAPCGLQTLSALEVLQLGFNGIHSLSACRFLPLGSLKVLFLQGNDISRIEGLESLSQVRELVLDKNKIRHVDFGALLSLVNLRELRVEENGLKSLSNFSPLPRLQALHLGSNRIADMSDMDKLTVLPCLLDCTLANNPIARKQLYRATAIQKLASLRILDNKEITPEERDRVDVLFAMETRTAPTYLGGVAAGHNGHSGHSHTHTHQHQHPQSSMQSAMSKVPIKMSSMTFDQLSGGMSHAHGAMSHGPAHGIGNTLAGPSHQQASFVCIGLSKNNDQHQVCVIVICLCRLLLLVPCDQLLPGAGFCDAYGCLDLKQYHFPQRPSDSEWHPFHNSTGDFFLPAGVFFPLRVFAHLPFTYKPISSTLQQDARTRAHTYTSKTLVRGARAARLAPVFC